MTLSQIKQHMERVKTSNLHGLCTEFCTSPDVIEPMLQHWIRKGKLKESQKTSACGVQCQQCDSTLTCLYEWL